MKLLVHFFVPPSLDFVFFGAPKDVAKIEVAYFLRLVKIVVQKDGFQLLANHISGCPKKF